MWYPLFQMSVTILAGLFEWHFIMTGFFGGHFCRDRFFSAALFFRIKAVSLF